MNKRTCSTSKNNTKISHYINQLEGKLKTTFCNLLHFCTILKHKHCFLMGLGILLQYSTSTQLNQHATFTEINPRATVRVYL